MAGPLVFCFLLGVALLMTGKMYMGYIYGIGFVGSMGIYFLLHVMTEHNLGTADLLGSFGSLFLMVSFFRRRCVSSDFGVGILTAPYFGTCRFVDCD